MSYSKYEPQFELPIRILQHSRSTIVGKTVIFASSNSFHTHSIRISAKYSNRENTIELAPVDGMQCGKFNSHTVAMEHFFGIASCDIDQHNEFSLCACMQLADK